MEYEVITTLISNNGFPIVMCLILVWYINTTQKSLTTAIESLKETLAGIKQQLDDLRRDV